MQLTLTQVQPQTLIQNKVHFLIIGVVIILAIIARLVPHLPNFSLLSALAIFSGTYLTKRQAVMVPLAVRFISDLILGFFSWPLMIAVYAAHLFGVLIGLWIKRSAEGSSRYWIKVSTAGLISATIFFVITNLVVFYPEMYPQTITGQFHSFVNALPFFRATLLGDVSFSIMLFGALALIKQVANKRYFLSWPTDISLKHDGTRSHN